MKFLSLFSGIEAASVAWTPLGWQCVGVAEIEPFPCAVLAHHYPDVPNLGSVTDITDEQIAALGPIDVVVGGSPCQDLSVAGKRAGLAGERSGLFHHQLRIFHAARHLCGARYLLWENVPGAFSSNRGRDFAVVVGEMAGCSLPVPPDGWGTEGVVLGEHGLVEWAVLDAQWFGVAQRRRRVFAVLDVGDWSSRPPILLERDGLRGDSAPSREAGKVAPTIPSRRTSGGGLGTDFDCDGGLIARPHADLSPALKARDSKGPSSDGDGDGDGAILVPMVAHSLRGEGFDASEDGTGRGTPLVPVAFNNTGAGWWADADIAATVRKGDEQGGGGARESTLVSFAVRTANTSANGHGIAENVAHTLDQAQGQCVAFAIQAGALRTNPSSGPDGVGVQADHAYTLEARAEVQAVAFTCKDYGADASDIAPTLRSMGHDSSHANGGGQVAVAFGWQNSASQGDSASEFVTPTLDKSKTPAVAVSLRGREGGGTAELGDEVQNCLRASGGGGDKPHVLAAMQVRRLTVKECARLQGFPDDYLSQVPWRGKPHPPDGPMYKALGNSMAVPVMRWICEHIAAASKNR